MRKASVHFQNHKRDGDSCAIVASSVKSEGRNEPCEAGILTDKGKLLRVAECSVENVKQARFEQVLKDAENRAMTPGILSGALA
jgi:hypothetical protein